MDKPFDANPINVNDESVSISRPMAELRQSIFGAADLRAQWMAEYGIDTSAEDEVVAERTDLVPILKSSPRRQYGNR